MRSRVQITQHQFGVLYRVFLLRVVDLEILSADGDVTKLLGQFAALLAAVSLLFTAPLILLGGTLPQESLWTMEHFLLATTMVMVGLFSVFNWESIFPDRSDVLVLAPLPVRPGTLFSAKLGALISAVFVAVVALNVFTGVIWPMLFVPASTGLSGAARSFVAYWISLFLAALFIFCCTLAVQGLFSQFLPRQLFLRLSPFFQVALFMLFLGLYILEPSLESKAGLVAPENQHLLHWLPTYWFLGLFQELNGSMSPEFAPLATHAWEGLGAAALAALALVAFSYLHSLGKIVEQPDIRPGSIHLRLVSDLGKPFHNAIFFFTLRTLLRSRHHRVLLSFYLGIGFAVAIAFIDAPFQQHHLKDTRASVPFLTASFLMTVLLIAAVRVIAALPITVRANWIFRVTELQPVSEYMTATRRTILMLTVVPACALSTAYLSYAFSPLLAAKHLLVLSLVGALLVEAGLYNFQKIPFTCSYLPGKGNLQYVFWVSALIVLPLIGKGARLEARMFDNAIGFCAVLLSLLAAFFYLHWPVTQRSELIDKVKFEEAPSSEISALVLHGE